MLSTSSFRLYPPRIFHFALHSYLWQSILLSLRVELGIVNPKIEIMSSFNHRLQVWNNMGVSSYFNLLALYRANTTNYRSQSKKRVSV